MYYHKYRGVFSTLLNIPKLLNSHIKLVNGQRIDVEHGPKYCSETDIVFTSFMIKSLSNRNQQQINDWFLYAVGLRDERAKKSRKTILSVRLKRYCNYMEMQVFALLVAQAHFFVL